MSYLQPSTKATLKLHLFYAINVEMTYLPSSETIRQRVFPAVAEGMPTGEHYMLVVVIGGGLT